MKYHVEFDIDFRRNPYKGTYIVLEGVDGSGKTTQVDCLEKYFIEQGVAVVKTREPRKENGLIAELVQEILLGSIKVPSVAFQYLFSADRSMHHEELVIPALEEGKVVISDRSFWSAVPYGILDRGESVGEDAKMRILVAQSILSMYYQFISPDYTFYLDIGASESWDRLQKKVEEIESREIYEKKEYIRKLQKGYALLLEEFPEEFTVVDAKKTIDEVTKDILQMVRLK
jgi:dTMP kinase